ARCCVHTSEVPEWASSTPCSTRALPSVQSSPALSATSPAIRRLPSTSLRYLQCWRWLSSASSGACRLAAFPARCPRMSHCPRAEPRRQQQRPSLWQRLLGRLERFRDGVVSESGRVDGPEGTGCTTGGNRTRLSIPHGDRP